MKEITREKTRREFLRDFGCAAGAAAAAASGLPAFGLDAKEPDLIVVEGEDPKAMVKRAVAEIGGMKRFVSRGDVVVIKPNIGWDRRPEQAANTNPDVVAGLIEMAFDAGAKEVKVFDRTVDNPRRCYEASGIAEAARKAGAKVLFTRDLATATIPIKGGRHLKESKLYKDALECDCYINVPIAKTHGSARLTMAMKNHLGLTADNRGFWHKSLHQAIADFALGFKPKLNVLDAYRIMIRGGPKGGSLRNVRLAKKCIVGLNQASVDAYGATLFGKRPSDIPHIEIAGRMGVGEIDVAKLRIRRVRA